MDARVNANGYKIASWLLLASYAITSVLGSAILIKYLSPSALQLAYDTLGVIEYFEAKGRDRISSSAIFYSSIGLSPLAIASWHYSYLAGGQNARSPTPWLTVAGLAYATALASGLVLLRPSGPISKDFSLGLLNLIIRNDITYFLLIILFIWAGCAFIHMSFIYPLTRVFRFNHRN